MGSVTITPQYTDYGANTWASLGADEANWKAVIQQVCDDFHNGLTAPSGNINFIIDFGVASVGPTGTPSVANFGGTSNDIQNTQSYANLRTKILSLTPANSDQTNAFAASLWPSTIPSPFTGTPQLATAQNLALFGPDGNGTNGDVLGYTGIGKGWTNFDLRGLGATAMYGVVIHEVSEHLGRVGNPSQANPFINDFMTWHGVSDRTWTNSSTARYISPDQGTTNLGSLNTGAGDPGDLATTGNRAFDATGPNSSSVSRSSSLPLTANDWRWMTILGWGLTSTGLTWAGLSAPSVPVFSFLQLHR